jgi:hypothetical protein
MNKLFKRFSNKNQPARSAEAGQSLVEMTIIVPLLLFMFLGLIEVGWAIRGYLVLLSTDREAVRFAARGESLNFGGVVEDVLVPQQLEERVGYSFVKKHANDVLESNKLGAGLFDEQGNPMLYPLDDAGKGAFLMTHIFIDTALPCHPNDITGPGTGTCFVAGGSCDDPAARKPDYPYDDLILVHTRTGYQHFFYTIPYTTTTYDSRIDINDLVYGDRNGSPDDILKGLKGENDLLNCEIQQRDAGNINLTFSVNSLLVGEAFYDQPQLLGFPFFQFAGNEVPLYVQTKMRITSDSLPQGGACEAIPLGLQVDALDGVPEGAPVDDVEYGAGSGNFVWLRWRAGTSVDTALGNTDADTYLAGAINNDRLAVHDYENSGDVVLNVGDAVPMKSADAAPTGDVRDAMENLVNRVVTVPVGTISGGSFNITRFARLRLTEVDFDAAPNKIFSAVYMGDDPYCYTQSHTAWE